MLNILLINGIKIKTYYLKFLFNYLQNNKILSSIIYVHYTLILTVLDKIIYLKSKL
jgi:hypothetical protein